MDIFQKNKDPKKTSNDHEHSQKELSSRKGNFQTFSKKFDETHIIDPRDPRAELVRDFRVYDGAGPLRSIILQIVRSKFSPYRRSPY